MIKVCKTVLTTMLAIVCVAAISASTLMLKARYDQMIEAAVQARLTHRGHAADLSLPDFGNVEELPGRQKVTSSDRDVAIAQAIIDEELRDASPEEREIWSEELKQRSPREIREILSLRHRFSPPHGLSFEDEFQFMSSENEPPRTLPDASIAKANPTAADAMALTASSIAAVQTAEQVVLNNIANAGTIGFKRSRVLFEDAPYRQMKFPGRFDELQRDPASGLWRVAQPKEVALAVGSGTAISAVHIDLSPGKLRHTRQSLDLAIQGDGYFQIHDGRRIVYSRAGAFVTDANGRIVLIAKDRSRYLEPSMTVPRDAERLTIAADGVVSVLEPGHEEMTEVGRVQLARFINPQGLAALGDNLFESSTASGDPIVSSPGQDGLGEIRQEHLEESNVTLDEELPELRRLREQLKALRQQNAETSDTGRGN